MISEASEHSALNVQSLDVGYTSKSRQTVILEGIDFSLDRGELLAIVGVNGIGKSTLLRTLGKVQPKLSGNIALNGKDLGNYSPLELAATVSVVLTDPIASKNLSVLELVALGRQPYTNWIGKLGKRDSSKILEAMELLELIGLQQKKCHELSDGQLQRVLIARALAQDTSIIFLDEPTSHLDLYHKIHILKLLKSIAHNTNKTIVFTSHEIEMAIQLCDKILILNQENHFFGAPCQLIEQKAFETLFPEDTVVFDGKTGSFRIKK